MGFLRRSAYNFMPLILHRASVLTLCAVIVSPIGANGQTRAPSPAQVRESTLSEVVVVGEDARVCAANLDDLHAHPASCAGDAALGAGVFTRGA
jgi:hypothetical protein